MSKKANPTVIGSFVVGAAILLVVGILVFGSGRIFGDTLNYVLYFEDSLKGLHAGAPVMFRGTSVGVVSDIKVVIDGQDQSIRVPVFIELDEQEVEVVNAVPESTQDEGKDKARDREFIRKLVLEQGLRAQLEMQSLVTGQLIVQLDFIPGSPITLHPEFQDTIPEFPTVPSSLKQLAQKLEDLPLNEFVGSAVQAIQTLDRFLNDPALATLAGEARALVGDLRKFMKEANREFPKIVGDLDETIQGTQQLVNNINDQVQPLSSGIQEAAVAARESLTQAQGTLTTIEGVIDKDSPLRFRLSTALKELAAAARSVRDLADYLERHPEAIVQGKQ